MLDNISEYQKMSEVETSHWWYVTLHHLVLSIAERKQIGKDSAILDAGCGTGGLLKLLSRHGYVNLTGFDLSETAVSICQKSNLSVTQLDMLNMAEAYGSERFDLIVSNDTLCYLDEASQVDWTLQCSQLLRPGGILIANVPAHDCFGGIHDRCVGIRQRFTPARVRRIFQGSSLHVRSVLYWPFFLAPAIFLARTIQRARLRREPDIDVKSDIDLPGPRINSLLLALCRVENKLLPWKPVGSSLIICAEQAI
jgi:SAM-dependent methyltransferase